MEKNISEYRKEIVEVVDVLKIGGDLEIVGSASIRNLSYWSDIDCYNVVNRTGKDFLLRLRKDFQEMIRKLQKLSLTYVGDIKCGQIDEWEVVKGEVKGKTVHGYNYKQSKSKLDSLLKDEIISPDEFKDAKTYLKPNPSALDFLEAKGNIKFQIVRWTPAEILSNKKILRNGQVITLEEAFQNGLTKVDCVRFIENRFIEISCIYEFQHNGVPLNKVNINISQSLQNDILLYKDTNPFKALKRKFTLAKFENDTATVNKLIPLLNKDVSILYLISADIGTIINLLEDSNVPIRLIKLEIRNFVSRLNNVYIHKHSKIYDSLVKAIDKIARMPNKGMIEGLEHVKDKLDDIVRSETITLI